MRRDLSGAPPEALGAQLLAGLNGFRPRIEECARGAPWGEGSQAGDGSRAQDASRTESADPGKLILALVTQGGLSEGKLNDEGRRLLGELQAATTGPGASRGTLLLDVETLDGTVRVIDVAPDRNGSTDDLLVGCARKELREQLIPVPAARAGHRVPVVYTLDPAGAQARPR